LVEAIHKEMEDLRKLLMVTVSDDTLSDVSLANAEAQEKLIELRKMFEELAAKAERPTIEDVVKLSPGEYVATMKPLVGNYHRQLMTANLLAPCLCEDLQATGCILMLVGDGNTVVRTAVDPNRPEVQLAVEAILQTLDGGIQQVMTEGVAEAEKFGTMVTESELEPAP
jgi:hypothetical protein